MVKRTYNNFLRAMKILQNQAYMTKEQAEERTRQIFDWIEYDRKTPAPAGAVPGAKSVQQFRT